MSSATSRKSSEKQELVQLTDRDEVKLDREYLPKSFYQYVLDAWHIIEPAIQLVDSWYVGAICEHLQAVSEGQIKKLIINVPPRTLKSSLVSVLWPTWEWAREPSLRSMFASYAQRLALRLLALLRIRLQDLLACRHPPQNREAGAGRAGCRHEGLPEVLAPSSDDEGGKVARVVLQALWRVPPGRLCLK